MCVEAINDISLLESVQRRATKWILNDYKSDYKSRLATLRLLPLMMTYELNDLKFFIKSLQNPTSGFNILDYVSFSCSSRAYGARLRHCHARNNKSRHFYFPRLWNSLPPIDIHSLSMSQIITSIISHFHHYFITNFDPSDKCSFHFLCPCISCHLVHFSTRLIE